MTSEIWQPVKMFNGELEASNLGRIRRLARPLIYKDGRKGMLAPGLLNGTVGGNGYRLVSYGNKKVYVHRLVAEAFLAEPIEVFAHLTVNHKNGDKLDNRADNLEWSSQRDNQRHARNTGLNKQHGENCNLSKYSEQLVEAMRRVHAKYSPNYEELGELFGMSGMHAGEIIRGVSRKRG